MSRLVLVALVALVAGCTSSDVDPERDLATPPPLTPAWTIEGRDANPQWRGQHHWASDQAVHPQMARQGGAHRGTVLFVDARSGRSTSRRVEVDRWPCAPPEFISDSGLTPALWARVERHPNGTPSAGPCTRLTLHDASDGDHLWTVDLTALPVAGRPTEPVRVGASDELVVVADQRGNRLCLDAATGRPRSPDDIAHSDCLRLTDRLTGQDLPLLRAPDGSVVDPAAPNFDDFLLGRDDDLVLLRVVRPEGGTFARAHDASTGETRWESEPATPDPYTAETWDRTETWFMAPSGPARVSYAHPQDAQDAPGTPMTITAMDPDTGGDLEVVASIEGGWFAHQFGDVTVALTDQHLGFGSTISGFALPRW